MARESVVLSSDHAVLSADLIVLRTPIDGKVTALSVKPGEPVQRGELLGVVENARVDTQRLEDLRAQIQRLKGEEESLAQARDKLRQIEADLSSRTDLYAQIVQKMYAERLDEAERLSAAFAARSSQLQKERDRRASLRKLGLTPEAEFDKAAAEALAAASELQAARARIAATRVQREGAKANIFVEMGSQGASYAQQRMDEVALRLADIQHLAGAREAERLAAQGRLAAEESRVALLQRFDVRSPGAGIVWRVVTSAGEQAQANTPLIEVVECSATFLLVAAPQERAARMSIGDPVSYRMAGTSEEHGGRVAAILGSHSAEGERFSARPATPRGPSAMVRVTPDETAKATSACDVGRNARVVFEQPAKGPLASIRETLGRTLDAARRAAGAVRNTIAG